MIPWPFKLQSHWCGGAVFLKICCCCRISGLRDATRAGQWRTAMMLLWALTTKYKFSQSLCKTKWKPEAIEKTEVWLFFPNCLTQGFRSGWSRWFMRCAHVHKSCSPEAWGGKSNPPQSWGTLVSPFWMKMLEIGKPVVPHVEFCLFGSICLIHNFSVAH